MKLNKLFAATALSLPIMLAGCMSDGDNGKDGAIGATGPQGAVGATGPQGDAGIDATGSKIALSVLGSFASDLANRFDVSAAEIVDYDPVTKYAFIVNAESGAVDVVDASAPSAPTKVRVLDVASDVATAASLADATVMGSVNSVAVYGDLLAVAIEANPKQNPGYIAFYKTDGTFLSTVVAGALPDMLTFTPDGNYVLSANEGEPSGDYLVDPEGSITLVDVSNGAANLGLNDAAQLNFHAFEAGGSKTLENNVRIAAKAASVSADLEPEYIAVSPDSTKAFVSLQENNAIAVVDIDAGEITSVRGLGFKNYSIPGNEIDASNKDGGINIRNWPVYGTYMPDSIAAYDFNGVTYLVTANEGDGREYIDGAVEYLDEIRIKDLTAAQINIPNWDKFASDVDTLIASENIGRLKIITDLGVTCDPASTSIATTGQPDATCVYDGLYSFGARSFTIWNTETGMPVFDSGSDFEVITANRLGELGFNASNDSNETDDRSDDKGPEPEGVTLGEINGHTYAFIGLERVGGVMVYDITNPETSSFIQYINNRDFSVADVEADIDQVGDLGPEGLHFVPATDSPTGKPMLVVGNEVSGTTTFYDVTITNSGM